MVTDGQDLGAGDAQLDGEGEYTPPAGEDPQGGVSNENSAEIVETTDTQPAKKEIIQGGDFTVGGGEPIDESDVEMPTDGVEYSAPIGPDEDIEEYAKTPMDEIAEGISGKVEEPEGPSLADAVAEPDQTDNPIDGDVGVITPQPPKTTPTEERMPGPAINPDTAIEQKGLTQSNKPGFDPHDVQDARSNKGQDGGIARNRTTGNQFRNDDGQQDGGQLRPDRAVGKPDYSEMYEVTGFTASFEKIAGQGNVNVEIQDHFHDLATAQASVNGEKYLMPMPQIGYKIVDIISGAPTISHQDRILYEYINNKWRRK